MTELLVPAGVQKRWKWLVKNRQTRELVDLTVAGYEAVGEIRNAVGGTLLYEWPAGDLDLTAAGEVFVTIPGSVSEAWPWSQALYELRLNRPDGEATFIDSGVIKVRQGVIE